MNNIMCKSFALNSNVHSATANNSSSINYDVQSHGDTLTQQLYDALSNGQMSSSLDHSSSSDAALTAEAMSAYSSYRRASLYGPITSQNDMYNDANSTLDAHLLKLLTSLGQTSSSGENFVHDGLNRCQQDKLYSNAGRSLYDGNDPSLYTKANFNPSTASTNTTPASSNMTSTIASARRLSMLASSTSRRSSIGVSVDDIERILNIDTKCINNHTSTSYCNDSCYSKYGNTPITSNVCSKKSSIDLSRLHSCESLSRKLSLPQTLSKHLLDLCNNDTAKVNEERSNATFNYSDNHYKRNSMVDTNSHLLNLFNNGNENARGMVKPDSHSSISSRLNQSSNNGLSQTYSNFTPEIETSLSSTYHYQQPKAPSKINPLDNQSPFYSDRFAKEYKHLFNSLVRRMDQSSKSRIGFEEVKRQLNQNKMNQINLSSTGVDPLNASQGQPISYADIKATRRRTTKKPCNKSKLLKKKQYNKHQHRRSLSLKFCTPEMIFG